jgi:hypothetical protein
VTLLNQLVAIEKGVNSTAERAFTDAYHYIQRDALFGGIERTYKADDDDGDQLPRESTKVQVSVEDLLDVVSDALTRLFDVRLTKDNANTEAKASIVVEGGIVIGENVPVTFLLTLENKLVDLRTFITKLPLLDPAEDWAQDGQRPGVVASVPYDTTKTKKIPKSFEASPATDRHPAQVTVYNEDIIVGRWTTRKFSGKISAARHAELLERIDKLTEAVKFARVEANTVTVKDRKIGAIMMDYLFG